MYSDLVYSWSVRTGFGTVLKVCFSQWRKETSLYKISRYSGSSCSYFDYSKLRGPHPPCLSRIKHGVGGGCREGQGGCVLPCNASISELHRTIFNGSQWVFGHCILELQSSAFATWLILGHSDDLADESSKLLTFLDMVAGFSPKQHTVPLTPSRNILATPFKFESATLQSASATAFRCAQRSRRKCTTHILWEYGDCVYMACIHSQVNHHPVWYMKVMANIVELAVKTDARMAAKYGEAESPPPPRSFKIWL